MQVSNPNNVKIYNLSCGKSLPEWISDRKKRKLLKTNVEVRKRIELIQDFNMPTVSSCVQVSEDGEYILATGIYKPRVRCYDVNQLSMKFERCFDAEVVKFLVLSQDYSKIVFLQTDRFLEFHAQYGKYYRTRVPKFGRDLAYHTPSCDLYIVGTGNEIYRLNLEQGRFLNSFVTEASALNVCKINPVHQLITCGTTEGRIEAWDPRSRHRVGIVDCALSCATSETEVQGLPSVTSIAFKDGLKMAVGTATGQVLLYDIRSDKPILVKDHLYGLPVTGIEFHGSTDLVISMDKKIVRLWEEHTGKAFTSIEPGVDLNDICVVPNSGMIFLANEGKKMLTYYVPSLGPAPRWCSFLDNLTEELEENFTNEVYDDYKFVTAKDLEDLGMSSLIGSNLLKAYMHGYFMDMRLYHKAKVISEPFSYDDYKKKKIKEKIEEYRANRVKIQKLPQVNKHLAEKLMNAEEATSVKVKATASILKDDRFKSLFVNPDFEVDEASEEFRLLRPVVSMIDQNMKKKQKKREELVKQFDPVDNEPDGKPSDEDDNDLYGSSSDDDHAWTQEVKRQHRLIKNEDRIRRRQEDMEAKLQPSFYQLKEGQVFFPLASTSRTERSAIARRQAETKISLESRLEYSGGNWKKTSAEPIGGNKQVTFVTKKEMEMSKHRRNAEKHHEDRKKLARTTKSLKLKKLK